MNLKERLIYRWDRFVYWAAYRSINRLCKSNRGFTYLLELHLRKWREQHPLPPELQDATLRFFEALDSVGEKVGK